MVKIVPNYYDTLPPYMETIFSLTKHAIEKDEEEVAKQAIEFWSSICEEEIDLIDVRDGPLLLMSFELLGKD
jgi:importin subunit beta-1